MWRLVIYGLMLVVIMVFRPQGLMGYRDLNRAALTALISRLKGGAGRGR